MTKKSIVSELVRIIAEQKLELLGYIGATEVLQEKFSIAWDALQSYSNTHECKEADRAIRKIRKLSPAQRGHSEQDGILLGKRIAK